MALFFFGSTHISHLVILLLINENLSNPLPLHQGIPQGSVLGFLLFFLYSTALIAHSYLIA